MTRESRAQLACRQLRGVAILCFSALLFPLAAALCLPCYVLARAVRALRQPPQPASSKRRTVLILAGSKGKALHLARLFKAEGYTVVVVEHRLHSFVGASFSLDVDAFHYVPIPTQDPQGYQSAILRVVKDYDPDLLVPIDPRTVELDAQLFSKLPKTCMPLNCEAEVFRALDNKDTFIASLHKHGIRAPRTELVTSKQQALDLLKGRSQNCVFKPIIYDDVFRTNITPPEDEHELGKYLDDCRVSPSRPYVIQEKLEGPEMSSGCLVWQNQLIAHSVGFSSPVHQTQNHVHCEDIVRWTEDFLQRYPGRLNGFVAFDFMRSPADGLYYPLECNPRLHTCFMLFSAQDGVIPLLQAAMDRTSASDRPGSSRNPPSPGDGPGLHRVMTPRWKQMFYLLNVLWEIAANPLSVAVWRRNSAIMSLGHEAIFRLMDPLPFLALNFLQMPAIILHFMRHRLPWDVVDYNIGIPKMA